MALQVSYAAKSNETLLINNVNTAFELKQRLIGLLKHQDLATGEGLWIKPCTSIHSFFMRFTFDAIFLNQDNVIVRMYQDFKPFRISAFIPSATSVLEMPAGTLAKHNLNLGQTLSFTPRTHENSK